MINRNIDNVIDRSHSVMNRTTERAIDKKDRKHNRSERQCDRHDSVIKRQGMRWVRQCNKKTGNVIKKSYCVIDNRFANAIERSEHTLSEGQRV